MRDAAGQDTQALQFLSLLQFFLDAFALADVAAAVSRARDLAGAIADGRDTQRDLDARAVFVRALRLECRDRLAAANGVEDGCLFAAEIRRHQDGARAADHFGG